MKYISRLPKTPTQRKQGGKMTVPSDSSRAKSENQEGSLQIGIVAGHLGGGQACSTMSLLLAGVGGNESLKESILPVTGGDEATANTPGDEYDYVHDGEQYDDEEEEEEEEVVMDEEEMLRMLDQVSLMGRGVSSSVPGYSRDAVHMTHDMT